MKFKIMDNTGQIPLLGAIVVWESNDSVGESDPRTDKYVGDAFGSYDGKISLNVTEKPTGWLKITASALSKLVRNEDGDIIELEDSRNYKSLNYVARIPDNVSAHYEFPTIRLETRSIKPNSSDHDGLHGDLEEFTFTASKIKFYHKGDTLVYNADAFVMAEGARLDALLAKLPGVELKNNGVIYCNGRIIQELLINGRDLFDKKNELALENIAAYTIKDIAVYDRRGRVSELMDLNVGGDQKYVMDVRLKREYSMGGTVNADAGYGTHDRYLGKLFGMWFTDEFAITGYGSINNLSSDITPGKPDETFYANSGINSGMKTNRKAGLTYNARGYRNKWEVKGGAEVSDNRTLLEQTISRDQYLQEYSVNENNWQTSRNKRLNIKTDHEFFAKLGRRAIIEVKPEFSYNRTHQDHESLLSSFRSEDEKYSREEIEAIVSGALPAPEQMINSRKDDRASTGKRHEAAVSVKSDIRLGDRKPPFASMLTLKVRGCYGAGSTEEFDRYRYVFGDASLAPEQSHRYRHGSPDQYREISASATYTQFLDFLMIQLPLVYTFTHTDNRKGSAAYLLSAIDDYQTSDLPLKYYPDAEVRPMIYDPSQSYESHEVTNRHFISFSPYNMLSYHGLTIHPSLNLMISERHYDYSMADMQQSINKTSVLPHVSLSVSYDVGRTASHSISANISEGDSPLYMFIHRPTDGLQHYLGNDDIKSSRNYNVNYNFWKRTKINGTHYFYANYNWNRNNVTVGSFYNMINGETYYQARYVNGESASARYKLMTPLGRNKEFNVETATEIDYNKSRNASTAYVGNYEDLGAVPTSDSYYYSASEKLKLSWQRDVFNLSAFANLKLNSQRGDYNHYKWNLFWDCNYGVSGLVNLPKNWSLSTDLTLYTRRGFTDSRLNTTDVIWNARISKSILKGSLVFVVDGYDMLQQLSNVTYMVNAQARTETVSNVIPSYVLFHIQYRFNRQPKKH